LAVAKYAVVTAVVNCGWYRAAAVAATVGVAAAVGVAGGATTPGICAAG
jgi:hypothetical protein